MKAYTTPGPCEVREYGQDDSGKEVPLHLIWSNSPFPCLVAKTCSAITSEANAMLIAAAPEMLDMLEETLAQLRYLDGRFPTGTTPNIISRIEALIQKATKP